MTRLGTLLPATAACFALALSPMATSSATPATDSAGTSAARYDEYISVTWSRPGTYTPSKPPHADVEVATTFDKALVSLERNLGDADPYAETGWEAVDSVADDDPNPRDPNVGRTIAFDFVVPTDFENAWTYRIAVVFTDVDDSTGEEHVYGPEVTRGYAYTFEPDKPKTTKYDSAIFLDTYHDVAASPGRPIKIEGSISGAYADVTANANRLVTLSLTTTQKNTSQPLTKVRTNEAGEFTATVPASWVYTRNLIASVEETHRRVERTDPDDPGFDYVLLSAATTEQSRRIKVKPLPLRYKPLGNPKSWASVTGRRNGTVSFDGCQPIGYRVNLGTQPKFVLGMIDDLLEVVERQTGYRFVYEGATNQVPYTKDQQALDQDLTFAWATEKAAPILRGSVVGQGGSGHDGDGFISQGALVMEDSPWNAHYPDPKRALQSLIAHELGHAMGLAHVTEQSQVMYPTVMPTHRGVYEAGDLTGLFENSPRVRGCKPDTDDTVNKSAGAHAANGQLAWVVRR